MDDADKKPVYPERARSRDAGLIERLLGLVPGRLLLALLLVVCGVAHSLGISLYSAMVAGAVAAIGYLCLWSFFPRRSQSNRQVDE